MFPAASPDPAVSTGTDRSIDIPALAVVAVYAALQIALMIGHDPWLDEAQAWLWATAPIANPIDFFIIPGEGHPPLWHWLLRALSSVLDFSQVRYITLPIAILNAYLLSRLLRGELVLLFLLLGSFTVLQFWGYHFRPYGLVFTCIISALLLQRDGRPIAGTWALAIACALHFFAGFLLAFWLVWQWHQGTRLTKLLPPALFAAVFGVIAILSALGNTTAGPENPDILAGILYNLGWIGMAEPLRGPVTAVITIAALIFGLRRQPMMLVVLLVLLTAFSVGTALIYGKYPWHSAFQTMLCFLAFMLVGINAERRWILVLLLTPQFFYGLAGINYRLANPAWAGDDLYAAIVADAGVGFDPQTDLFAWPELAAPAISAVNEIKLRSGNDGLLLGPINWRTHREAGITPDLLDNPGPYWLVCADCQTLRPLLEARGHELTLLGTRLNVDNGEFNAYRID